MERNGRAKSESGRLGDSETPGETAKSAQIADAGIYTSKDVLRFSRHLLADVMNNRIPHSVAGVANRTVNTMLRTVQMEHQFGTPDSQDKTILLDVPDVPTIADPLSIRREQLLAELAALDASGDTAKEGRPLPKKG